MPDFNTSQTEAIQARNPSILVSAAAGSGKTTVMVEKIRETLIHEPEASISQFLVITFTKDAARNMKDKLRDLLEQGARDGLSPAARALNEMETASISTIHSFCTQLLKEYNDHTGASMNPRVLKDTEKKSMLDECFSDAVEGILGKDSVFPQENRKTVSMLLSAFSPEEVRNMSGNLYDVLMGIPDPFAFLEQVVHKPPYELWNREILTAVELEILGLEENLQRERQLMLDPLALPAYESIVQNDTELIQTFLEAFRQEKSAAEKKALLENTKSLFLKAPSSRGLDESAKDWKAGMDKVRDGIKSSGGILASSIKRIESMLDEKNIRLNSIIRQELQGLELLLREMASRYEKRKLESGTIDYADMEQIASRIMSDPEKRNELLARYRYIFVDECQDVSGIQDAIIKSLAGPGHQLFMVGDIKQSIYGFRHAEPELFDQERRSFSDDADAEERRIFFMDNYRSCRNVVEAVNEIFSEAMDERVTQMDYLPEDRLRCNLSGDFGPVDVILVRKGADQLSDSAEESEPMSEESSETEAEDPEASGPATEAADRLEAQCEAAGRYIRSLVPPSAEISGESHYRYRDIVILLRTARGTASAVVEHLKKMHIPALYEGAPDFFGLAEVKSFLSLLTVIDNLHHDDALVGTLINTPFLFTESDLADIRLEKMEHVPFYEAFERCALRNEKPIDRKCRQVADQLAEWRRISESMSVPDFVWWLMRETGIYAVRGAYPDGKSRQTNLDAVYQRALDGQNAGNMRLSDFTGSLLEARETRLSDSEDHPALGPGDNFVRVMTMHKSKGLEFPVVILMDLQRNIRQKQNDGKLRMDLSNSGKALGLYLPAVKRNRHIMMDSQGRDAFRIRAQRKNIAEETRLLYVAVTRAREKLCLIGSVKNGDETLWMNRTRASRIWKTRSMLDMIMPAVLNHIGLPDVGEIKQDAMWRLSCVTGKAIQDSEEAVNTPDSAMEAVLLSEEPMRMYLPEPTESEPLKTSVTTLSRHAPAFSEDDSEETLEDKRKTEEAVRTFRLNSVPSRPAFLEEEKVEAVSIGTATHRFMRLIRLEALRGKTTDLEQLICGEMERMKADRILTEKEAGMIRLTGVVSFFRSELGQRMLKSGDIRREADFTMQIRPGGSTMVQGIVDCAFLENGEWILIDYKTDRDTRPETFVPRHEMQMNWYRTALERLTRTPVREMWLFALQAGTAFPVRRIQVTG